MEIGQRRVKRITGVGQLEIRHLLERLCRSIQNVSENLG